MNKNVERGQATRAHLIDVATRLFAAHGYDGTSITAVLAESGVSRGSLYHHFPGKDALFWAVLEGVAARVGQQVADAERDAPDPVAALRAGDKNPTPPHPRTRSPRCGPLPRVDPAGR